VHADLAIDGRRFDNVGLRYKGNGTFRNASRGNGKYPLKIDLNKYVKGQKLAGVTTINLQNNVTDASWMNEVLAYRLYRDAGVPAPRSSYARVYLTVPGAPRREYWGLYSISENVDTNFALDRFGTRRGAILKPSTSRVFAHLGDDWARYTQTYDPKTDLTPDEQRRVIDFCRFVTSAGDEEFASRLSAYLDLEAFARYAAVLVWLANTDSLLANGQNYYVYLHPQTHRLLFVPWDQDGSFGNFGRFRGIRSESLDVSTPWQGNNRFLERVFAVEAFRTLYLAKLDEFSRTLFRSDRFAAQMAEIAPVIRSAIEDESAAQLRGFDSAVAGSAGIVPFARARAANVTRQLAER
jgi:spore coat protein CotH